MIEIKNISKKYKNQLVLNQLDIIINKGDITALLGSNGSGKSTLVNIIAGLVSNDSGCVQIEGKPANNRNQIALKPIGFVFETPIYIEVFSSYEYLNFVGGLCEIEKSEKNHRIKELMEFFDLSMDKKRIEEYSKGMKNKVSLAAALLNKPTYLILDEPFDGLDFVSARKIIRLLKEMAEKGVGILITSHQYGLISEVATVFAVLKNGKIELNLSKNELYESASKEFPEFEREDCVIKFLEKIIQVNESRENLSWL